MSQERDNEQSAADPRAALLAFLDADDQRARWRRQVSCGCGHRVVPSLSRAIPEGTE